MAESHALSLSLAPVSGDDLERAEKFAREPFVLEGEDPAVALAEGTPRRRRSTPRWRRSTPAATSPRSTGGASTR